MSGKFVHLHNHSEYSLLDGQVKFSELGKRLNELGMHAYALTDHGNLFGAIKFVETMHKYNVKPILGCEMYITDDMHIKEKGHPRYHLILLVKDKKGYSNLVKMVSRSYTEGFYRKPRIDKKLLAEHSEGLIGMSACIQGEIPRLLLNDRYEDAENVAKWYQSVFDGDFFIELQNHNLEEELSVIPKLIDLSKKRDIPVVATNDIHYLYEDDYESHEALLCIQTKKTFNDPIETRMSFSENAFFLRSYEEMSELFPDVPEAITNSLYIADKCNYAMEDELAGGHLFPVYEVPDNYTLDDYLRKLCLDGAKKKYGEITEKIENRLNYELNVVKDMGFPGYFLIVWDFIKYAKEHDIPVGPGRGSAAGSIIAYTLDITDIDPLRYDLLFERFLNPERISMPDIDVDISDTGRGDVIDYVSRKYGEDKVCQIATFGTMKARAVIRDVGRVLNVPLSKVDKFAKKIPTMTKSLEKAVEEDGDLRDFIFGNDADPDYKRIYDIAIKLEGISRHVSKHAAGVIISSQKLEEVVPLYEDRDGNIITQFDKDDSEKIGLLKIDFLGLKNLSIIQDAVKRVKRNHGVEIDIANIPLDDKLVYKMLGEGKTFGVFQFESDGMKEYLKKLRPERIEDLVAMNALYRPGPMSMIDTFIKRKHGEEKVEYFFPEMEEVLSDTYGVIVYQEQVMRLANILAGFTMGEADTLRKAMAKKKAALIEEMGRKFIEGAIKNGYDEKKVKELWALIEKFGQYGFNKSHSVCYAFIAYQTAYLKAHYPNEYMAAQLTNDAGNADRIALAFRECEKIGIEILPPDINKSFSDFRTEDNKIRYALSSIKNVGENAIKSIVEEREKNGIYNSVHDFFKRIDYSVVNKKVVEYLIYAGALDLFGIPRKTLFLNIENLMEYGKKNRENIEKGVQSLFGEEETAKNEDNIITDYGKWNKWDKLKFEHDAVGAYISGHPLEDHKAVLERYATTTVANLKSNPEQYNSKKPIIIGGIFTKVDRRVSKAGKKYITALFEDITSEIDVLVFNKSFEKNEHKIIEEKFCFIEGFVMSDDNFQNGDDAGNSEMKIKLSLTNLFSEEELFDKSEKKIYLKVNVDNFENDDIVKLKDLLRMHKGESPVFCEIFASGRNYLVRFDDEYRIEPDNRFMEEIKILLGEDGCRIEI